MQFVSVSGILSLSEQDLLVINANDRERYLELETQVISKQRVADLGEVLTGRREVEAMLDLVQSETARIDSRFLEPACGNGNFLSAVLERKLAVVEQKYKRSQIEFERYAILAAGSIYGIDILFENVQACQMRLLVLFDQTYTRLYKQKAKDRCREAVRFILGKNIVCGDALTLSTCEIPPRPIIFSQWTLLRGKFIRTDYAFRDLSQPDEKSRTNLFAKTEGVVDRDTGDTGFIPVPVRSDFPPVSYWELADVE